MAVSFFVKLDLVVIEFMTSYLTHASFFCSVVSPCLVKSGKVNSTESLQELLTSDSEGSYMGVGSPRDMQSPVFHERAEVNFPSLICCTLRVVRSVK